MYLESCEVTNFRGLRHLNIRFSSGSTVLIGENAWGKSSLLSALYLMLGQGEICSFTKEDLYVPIELKFSENEQDERRARALRRSQRSAPSAPPKERPAIDFAKTKGQPAVCKDPGPEIAELQAQQAEDHSELISEPLRQLFLEDFDFVAGDVFIKEAKFLAIDLIFTEPGAGVLEHSKRLQSLNPAWQLCSDGLHRIHWQAIGYEKNGNFITEHYLLDRRGAIINCSTEKILLQLMAMNPVLRMRDSRSSGTDDEEDEPAITNPEEKEIYDFSKMLTELSVDPDATSAEVLEGLRTLNEISQKYLSSYGHNAHMFRRGRTRQRSIKDMVTRPVSLESLSSLKHSLQSPELNKEKLLAVMFASALFVSKGARRFDRYARPILILEDIESRMHPSVLLSFWSVVEPVPVQKIVTTNSGDLISAIPLFSLRRLCRQYYDTRCYAVPEHFLSADDLRRIAFHIRLNRPMTLFARTWIFVEGETEIWMLSEMAALLGISLACEGIRMVEFAQCGLHPLMKLASALGISFYVLTDGDDAGKRYAQSVASFVGSNCADEHLTVLPHLDIEHFFYANGFAQVFQQAAGIPRHDKKNLHADKVIELAIHKKSKPGLALAVLQEMQQRGRDSVPPLFVKMLSSILRLAKSEMGLD